MIQAIFAAVGAVIVLCGLVFSLNMFGLANYKFFAPQYRAAENQVFKESEQYNDGMIRDLENLQMQYVQADDAHKALLKDIIIHRFSVYDQNRLPPNLWAFYQNVKSGKQ